MLHQRLWIATAVAVAALATTGAQVWQRDMDTRDAGRTGLARSLFSGGPDALAYAGQDRLDLDEASPPPHDLLAAAVEADRTTALPTGDERTTERRRAGRWFAIDPNDPLSRLRRLPDAGRLIEETLAQVDDVIREVDVCLRSSHFAEDCRDWAPEGYGYYQAHASRFVFAIEATHGRASEYCLCAARGPDGRCGLYVSVCEYRVVNEPREKEDGSKEVFHRVEIDRIYLLEPDALSLALRAQMLDELGQGNFIRAYRAHVREHGKDAGDDAVIRPWLPAWDK